MQSLTKAQKAERDRSQAGENGGGFKLSRGIDDSSPLEHWGQSELVNLAKFVGHRCWILRECGINGKPSLREDGWHGSFSCELHFMVGWGLQGRATCHLGLPWFLNQDSDGTVVGQVMPKWFPCCSDTDMMCIFASLHFMAPTRHLSGGVVKEREEFVIHAEVGASASQLLWMG